MFIYLLLYGGILKNINKQSIFFFVTKHCWNLYLSYSVPWLKEKKKNQDPFSCSLSCSGFEACVYCNLAMCMYVVPKGQLISEEYFGVFKSPKKQTFFKEFLPMRLGLKSLKKKVHFWENWIHQNFILRLTDL